MPADLVRAAGSTSMAGMRRCSAASLWVVLAATLLTGCAHLGSRVLSVAQSEFALTGRIAVRYGDQASSGNLAWRHDAAADELLITSPLGQGVARIVRAHGTVTLTAADGRRYRATDAEALTERVLGFRLPLAGLADWVRARPARGSPAQTRYNAAGHLAELDQSGWRIDYLAYEDGGKLPSRLVLTYPGLELRLAITRWQKAP